MSVIFKGFIELDDVGMILAILDFHCFLLNLQVEQEFQSQT